MRNLIRRLSRYEITPGSVISWLCIRIMNLWGEFWGTLRLRCKAALFGVRLGRNVRAHGTVCLSRWPGSRMEIGDGASIVSSWRRATAATLGAPTRLRTFGPDAAIVIGPRCELTGASIAVRSTSVILGRQVLLGPGCRIVDSDFHAPWPPEARADDPGMDRDRPVEIGDFAWLGMGCIVLKGVRIGRGAIIGAGSVVTHDVPDFHLAAGSPARVIRRLADAPSGPCGLRRRSAFLAWVSGREPAAERRNGMRP